MVPPITTGIKENATAGNGSGSLIYQTYLAGSGGVLYEHMRINRKLIEDALYKLKNDKNKK